MKNAIKLLLVVAMCAMGGKAWGAAPGPLTLSRIGADTGVNATITNGFTNYAMASLNTGWCTRFMAQDTRDIYTVYVQFGTVTAAGSITCRIETIDTATGKPTGTLYDANATKVFTPVTSSWNTITFATPPSTGLVAGNEYAIVLLTTTGGTTHTLVSSVADARYPCITLTAADGTTRTNFAEVTSTAPCFSLGFSDSAEESPLGLPFNSAVVSKNIFTTTASGMKLVLTGSLKIRGYYFYVLKTGTPAGGITVKTWDSTNAIVTGSTVTIGVNSLTNASTRICQVLLPAPITLAAGTYRVTVESQSSANSSNCWTLRGLTGRSSAVIPSGISETDTATLTSTPPTWSDTATAMMNMGILLDDSVTPSSGVPMSRIRTGF